MKNTKEKILGKARELFNEHGVAAVSIRHISRELCISHSNLIYHYKDKNEILEHLHQQILKQAVDLNQEILKENHIFKGLFVSVTEGFKIIYDYRFFMRDLNLIMKENKKLHAEFLEIEKLREAMYLDVIKKLVAEGIMKKNAIAYESSELLSHIRIISDYWISSSLIYESQHGEQVIKKYSGLLLSLFKPYLTKKGEAKFDGYFVEFGLS